MKTRLLILTVALSVPFFAAANPAQEGKAGASDSAAMISTPAPTATTLADQRFALMWVSGGVPRRAAIRGDASIRDSDDPGLIVTHVAAGQYCITATSPSEGAVGVLQDQTGGGGGSRGTIDVSMGIGNFCNAVQGAQIAVQTWQVP